MPDVDAWAGSADPFAAIAAIGGAAPASDQFAGKPDPFAAINAAEAAKPAAYGGTTAGKAGALVGSGLSQELIRAVGAPGDLIQGAGNLVAKGINAVTGSNIPMEESPIGSAAINRGFAAVDPRLDPANPAVQPQNELERVIKGGAEGAGAAVAPIGMVGALGDKAAAVAAPYIGGGSDASLAANAGIGGMSGAGGQGAADAVPDKWKPLAATVGGILVPATAVGGGMVAAKTAEAAWNAIPAITDASKTAAARAQVGQEMNLAATDRGAAMSNLESQPAEIIPGSQGTTGQVAGDAGLLGYEKGVAQSPEGAAALAQRGTAQNNARQAALATVQPQGNVADLPEAVWTNAATADAGAQTAVQAAQNAAATHSAAVDTRTAAQVAEAQQAHQEALANLQSLPADASPLATAAYFRQMRDVMEMEGAQRSAGASQTASTALAAAAPAAQTPEQVGAALREPAQVARETAASNANALYAALPKDMVAPTTDIAAKAKAIQAGMLPEHSPIVGEEARLLGLASSYGDQTPLANVNALRGSILSARSVLKRSDPQAYGRLGQLQQTVEGSVDHAVENRAALDNIAVRRGTMAPDDAMPARLQRVNEAEDAWRQATVGARGESLGGRPGRSEGGQAGGVRGGSQTDVGPGNAPGGEGLSAPAGGAALGGARSGQQPEIGSSTSTPLRQANVAYRNLKQTFDEGPVGDILAKTGRGQPDLSNAEVAAKVFHAKPTAGEDVRAYLKAAGDKGVPAVSDAAAFSLHEAATNADGTFNTAKATKWIDDHKLALNELPPEVRARFQNATDAHQAVTDLVAKQRENMGAFDKSEAGKVAGLSADGDIVKHVGAIVDSKSAPEARLGELATAAKGNPAATEGLKRAAIEHVLGKFVPEGGNPQTEKLQSYLADKKDVLGKVLSPGEVADLGAKAEAATGAKSAAESAVASRAEALKGAAASGKQIVSAAEQGRAEALSKYDRGVLGQLKGVRTSGDVLNVIKGIFGAKDGAAKMQALAAEAAAHDKATGGTTATDALKRAVQEHIQREYSSTTEAGTSGVLEQKRAGLASFMKTKTDALKASGLSDEQIGLLRAVTEDGLRANRSISVVKAKGGSDTSANRELAAKMGRASGGSMLGGIAIESGLAAAGHAVGGIPGLFIGKYLGDKVLASLREAGLSKVKALRVEAVLHPEVGHALMREFPLKPNSGTAANLALRARQIGLSSTLAGMRQMQ